MKPKRLLIVLGSALIVLLMTGIAQAQWLDPAWSYRRPVTISNAGPALADYQVRVNLDSSFDFSKAMPDGRDLRVTDDGGVTKIPFWIETWTPPTASIWVKVPSIPTTGATIYLYYGNSGATSASNGEATFVLFDDDWDLPSEWGNPIHTVVGEGSWVTDYVSYPNIFKEGDVYYMLYDGHTPHQKGLATSSDLVNWTSLPNPVVVRSNISGAWDQTGVAWGDTIKVGYTYYMLVAGLSGDSRWRIGVETSTDLVNWNRAPDGVGNPVLVASESWEGGSSGSVSGTSVLKELDGITPVLHDNNYWMAYHSYSSPYKIGLAYAEDPLGPWVKYTGNPILSPTETWESSGLWVTSMVREGDKYYIFYYGRSAYFHMGYAWCSVDDFPGGPWTKTTNYILEYGPAGSWDSRDHEDPIIRKYGDTYYLFYTGLGPIRYANGFATAPAITGPFTKYGGSTPGKWLVGGSPTVTDGFMRLTSGSKIESPDAYLPGHALGYRANFKGSGNLFKWGGFLTPPNNPPFAYIGTAQNVASGNLILTTYRLSPATRYFVNLGSITDAFYVYEVTWLTGEASGYIDHSLGGTLMDAVPSGPLPIQFHNYSDTVYPMEVDWVYLRMFSDPEPSTSAGAERLLGDVDGDGIITFNDYRQFRSAYGSCPGDLRYIPGADIDQYGCVTINDYRIFRDVYAR